MESRVELFAAIRRDERVEGLSIRALSERHHVHRRTVRQALESAIPPERKSPVRCRRRCWIRSSRRSTQCWSQIWPRHASNGIRPGGCWPGWLMSRPRTGCRIRRCGTMSRNVDRRSWAAANRNVAEGFVPQHHEFGAEAEVDFADLWIILRGVKTKVFLFTMRLSASGALGASCVRHPRAGGFPGRPRSCAGTSGWGAGRQDPLRQSEGGGVAGAVRPQPARVGSVDIVPGPLRLRRLLLPARGRRRA